MTLTFAFMWRAVCTSLFVLSVLSSFAFLNINVALAGVAMFFASRQTESSSHDDIDKHVNCHGADAGNTVAPASAVDQSHTAHSSSVAVHTVDAANADDDPVRAALMSADQMHTFLIVCVASLPVDYALLAVHAGGGNERAHSAALAHLASSFRFAYACGIVATVVKHVFVVLVYRKWSEACGHAVDPITARLEAFAWWPALKSLAALALPSSFSYLLGYLQYLISIVATGHLGPAEIGAAGIASMLANVSGSCVGQGFNMALDTLCSNAVGGGKFRLAKLWTVRAIVIQTLFCVPFLCVWFSAEPILAALGLPEVAPLAGRYARWLTLGLWPWLAQDAFKRYLQAHSETSPILASSLFSLVAHCFLTYALVFQSSWKFEGAALATALSNWNLLFSLVAFTWARRRFGSVSTGDNSAPVSVPVSPVRMPEFDATVATVQAHDTLDTWVDAADELRALTADAGGRVAVAVAVAEHAHDAWPLFSRAEVFADWPEFLKLGAPAALSLFFEWGSYECSAWAAGMFGERYLATHAIWMQTVALWYMIPLGVSVAAATLIGNSLGRGDASEAAIMTRVALAVVAVYAVLNSGAYNLFPMSWTRVFSDDADTVALSTRLFPVLLLYGLADATFAVTSGVLRGAGRPSHVAVGTTLGTFLIGAPLVYALAFKADLKLTGIWLAMTSTWAACTCAFSYVLFVRTNWDDEVAKAQARNARGEGASAH